ncbi:MAG TPA: transposase [Candidatus Methanoperedens sp.]|nr:transposase [Candidatus Methanoperedens sp.]
MSIVDKDARHGAKSDERKFTGYKVNSIMSEDGFIKNINATPGNSYDGNILIPLIDEMIEQGFTACEVVGDTAYGEVYNRNKLMLKGITIIAPFKKETNKNGLFPQSKFSIEKHAVVCPEDAGRWYGITIRRLKKSRSFLIKRIVETVN